ncbi:MAG: chemoreceptor glutamine deamidase CheD [Bradyrhizobiaceae bacterium]|nr:chemoreceptor glutamine deamidase CheD [Bradyrhizobiaceae bacterium]
MVKVLPGEFYVSASPDELLVTVLGSCVSACIRDPRTGIGGMNHFMLPKGDTGSWGDEQQSARYGNFAMEKLINEMLKKGCSRAGLEIKVFGGGNVIESASAIGSKNVEFVLHFLASEGLSCAAQDLGGQFPRRIQYSPATGKVIRKFLGSGDRDSVINGELEYARSLTAKPVAGEIQLFGDT